MIILPRRKLLTRAPFILCTPSIIRAACGQGGMGPGPGTVHTTTAAYAGPGNIVSGAAFWGGLRAYSAAVAATGTQKAVQIRRASDNTTQDILILTSGAFDATSATSFAGTDTTGTGSISGTTLTFTGGRIGDSVSGGTTLPGTFIVNGSSGAWTVNNSQTVASATLTLTYGIYVTTLYDQSGNGRDAVQATTTAQPRLSPGAGPSGQYAMTASTLGPNSLAITMSGISQPYSMAIVAVRNNSSISWLFSDHDGNNGALYLGSADSITIGGTTATATDTVWHALQGTWNGASANAYIDGVNTSGSSGASGFGNNPQLMSDLGGIPLQGSVVEAGIWPSSIAASNAAINTNMHGANGWNF